MKSLVPRHKFTWIFVLIILNLVLIYFYIFFILLNYDLTWMVYEKLKTHLWILENGKQWQWVDFARALNTKVIEIDPNRLSRPLSNLVEVIDTKFRANLWDSVPPHPTFSLQWPFLFIGLPLLLYRFFRNLNCQPIIALAGMSLYLTSSGFLSPIVMMSHPAKNMVNFFSILSLATITQLYRVGHARNVSIKSVPYFWWILISCFCWSIITFFSDETGLFLYIALSLVSWPLLLKFKEKAVLLTGFFLLPVVYFLVIHFLLPWLHYIANNETISLNNYRDFPSPYSLIFPNWHNFFMNSYLLFSVHPGLKWDFHPLSTHPFLIFLQVVYSLAFLLLIVFFIVAIYKKKELSTRVKQIFGGITLLVFFIFFHTFQLSHNVKIWTVFWYGCLFSLLYYSTLTLILQFVWEEFKGNVFKNILPIIIFIFTVHGLMTSTYLIAIFKNQGNDPKDFPYPEIYNGTINPYQYFDLSKSIEKSRCRYFYTLFYWSKVKHKEIQPDLYKKIQTCSWIVNGDPYFVVDTVYLTIEAALEYPPGRSFVNDPDYVAAWIHQAGEPP